MNTLPAAQDTSTPISTKLSPTKQAKFDAQFNKFPQDVDGKAVENGIVDNRSGLVKQGLGWVLQKTEKTK